MDASEREEQMGVGEGVRVGLGEAVGVGVSAGMCVTVEIIGIGVSEAGNGSILLHDDINMRISRRKLHL